ncbi:Chromate resistance protein ChrB [Phytohabitans rumicis]|uniref:ChrB N-terminal domain-containing protein n=1 Tax=Phytohabitans rumicis TaxID=1076125 RepID=A0A6V8LCB1_9ACTN|nr:Chromate resistance protein ChrB [Phytohabitans rumicis]GFJ94842.1 hypothetical protein Prum_084840 [Phytohabitans rumicis]
MSRDMSWLLLVYRVPTQSSRARVAVWRELKRLGALYLQQAVCVLPDREPVRAALEKVRAKINEMDGSSLFFVLDGVEEHEQAFILDGFRANSAKEYAEIVEECETKFFKEIEFERFRENYTFEETEEIRQDLEKLRRWMQRVEERDWFEAPGRADAVAKIAECERLLEEFEADVYERVGDRP